MPLYNMENLVARSVNSVQNQTYRNIEIIIVDDGSKDKGGIICDEIAKTDARVRVFHQENTGIAGAYLLALNNVTGEHICFLDCDDFSDPYMIELLMKEMLISNPDIVQGKRIFFYDSVNKPKLVNHCNNTNSLILDSKNKILDEYFAGRAINMSLGAKLYKSCLFDGLECKLGIQHIDVIFTLQIMLKCNKVSLIENTIQYVYLKSDSVSRGEYTEMHWNDFIFINKFFQEKIEKDCPEYMDFMYNRYVKSSMIACQRMLTSKLLLDKSSKIKECKRLSRNNFLKARKTEYYKKESLMTQIKCFIFYIFPSLFIILNQLVHKAKSTFHTSKTA